MFQVKRLLQTRLGILSEWLAPYACDVFILICFTTMFKIVQCSRAIQARALQNMWRNLCGDSGKLMVDPKLELVKFVVIGEGTSG